MALDYIPLLQIQRDLQGLPRDLNRFRQYLRTVLSDERDAVELPPLLMMNPMGKDHVTALLDKLLALNADGVAADAMSEVAAEVADVPGDIRMTFVVVDDLLGGWTNRYDYEFNLRFQTGLPNELPRWVSHHWLSAVAWSSEEPSAPSIWLAVRAAILRLAHVCRHGPAKTLKAMLAQEGEVLARAGYTEPALDADDLEYTREVLRPLLGESDKRTAIECLFGDAAGKTLGFTPRGLSPWAGLALALHDARSGAGR